MVALVIVLIASFSSDLLNERPKHIMTMASIATVALTITAAVENNKVRYAFLAIGMSNLIFDMSLLKADTVIRSVWRMGLQHLDTKLPLQYNLSTGREACCCNWNRKVRLLFYRLYATPANRFTARLPIYRQCSKLLHEVLYCSESLLILFQWFIHMAFRLSSAIHCWFLRYYYAHVRLCCYCFGSDASD